MTYDTCFDVWTVCVVQDKEPKGIIPLENIQIREVQDAKKPHCFELYSVSNEVRTCALRLKASHNTRCC